MTKNKKLPQIKRYQQEASQEIGSPKLGKANVDALTKLDQGLGLRDQAKNNKS